MWTVTIYMFKAPINIDEATKDKVNDNKLENKIIFLTILQSER